MHAGGDCPQNPLAIYPPRSFKRNFHQHMFAGLTLHSCIVEAFCSLIFHFCSVACKLLAKINPIGKPFTSTGATRVLESTHMVTL